MSYTVAKHIESKHSTATLVQFANEVKCHRETPIRCDRIGAAGGWRQDEWLLCTSTDKPTNFTSPLRARSGDPLTFQQHLRPSLA